MLSAKRKSDGTIVTAYFESKRNAPFLCIDCNEEVVLKSGRHRVDHFAHANPVACKFAVGESDLHRDCKKQIFESLDREPGVRAALERSFGEMRPDIFAIINGTRVAIEVQISSLSIETITRRTIQYAQNGIHVLWLLQWTPELDSQRYTPKVWERWVHSTYFGQVYYWIEGITVVSYSFEPHFKIVPKTSWYSKGGKRMTAGGYTQQSKRYCVPVRGETLNLVSDFRGQQRYWLEANGFKLPDAKLFIHTSSRN